MVWGGGYRSDGDQLIVCMRRLCVHVVECSINLINVYREEG